ncbi:MAG: hypothetical protein F6K61_03615 [Sphaerospermopsis sp. SIO1G1]|nr:hypothetical protein [Sphaerospermopsis sp. SIO1G1]
MQNKKIEWGMEIVQLTGEFADATGGNGIPGIGLIGKFAQVFYNHHLMKRFSDFCQNAEIDEELIEQIQEQENYSNYFYSVLETVRRTHSKLGLTSIALLYKDYWNNEKVLIPAMRSFSEISDQVLLAFIELYESIPNDKDYLVLNEIKDGEPIFHHLYPEGVELIIRNIFLQSSHAAMHNNGPIQGTKWEHTDLYYKYCIKAIKFVENCAAPEDKNIAN